VVEYGVTALNADNIKIRIEAANQLVDRIGVTATEPAKSILVKKDATSREYVHSLWVLHRLNALSEDIIKTSAIHKDAVIRVHIMRILGEQKDSAAALYPLISTALADKDVHVRRAAAELMGRYINIDAVNKLIAFRKQIEEFDSHLIYTIRLTLRNMLRHEHLMNEVANKTWQKEDAAVLATVLVGVQTSASATFLYNYLKANDVTKEEFPKVFMHITRFIPAAQLNDVIITGMNKGAKDADLNYTIFKSIQDGIVRRGGKESTQLQEWGKTLALNTINQSTNSKIDGEQLQVDKKKYAMELAGNYKLNSVTAKLIAIAKDTSNKNNIRTTALKALLKINVAENSLLAGELINTAGNDLGFKRDVINVTGEFTGPLINKVLAGIKNAEPELQQSIAIALSSTGAGKDILLDKVKRGEIFPRVLIQPKVEERLSLNISPKQQALLKELTANLEDVSKERQTLIHERVSAFKTANPAPSPAVGRTVFTRNCSPCHSIGDDGGVAIGPQLNSVGKWGVQSLSEKILDPNRNVSESFRTYTITLKDGKVVTGLFRRDEGAATIYADAAGKEFSIARNDIASRKASKYTLMPDQFGSILSQEEYNALIAYLLTVQD